MYRIRMDEDRRIKLPQPICDQLGLKPGQDVEVAVTGGRDVLIIPVRHPREKRGFLEGIDTTVENDPERL
jgi:AbrB family looped-hinge helix DNA binding protein